MAGEDVNFGTILDLLGEDEEFISDELLDVLEQVGPSFPSSSLPHLIVPRHSFLSDSASH